MARAAKYDYPPLLAPGRHVVTLSDVERLCVRPVRESSARGPLFYAFEEFVQRFLREELPCEMLIDGSFLTEKLNPDDVDVAVRLDLDVAENLTTSQSILVEEANQAKYIEGVDSFVYTAYPRGHVDFGTPLDETSDWSELYGLEHAGVWLKGIAVLPVWETRVGLLIRR